MESGGSYNYKYSGHDVILAAVNPLFAKHGVKVWPTTESHERVGNMTVLAVVVDFVNVDRPDDRCSVRMVNYGADKGDKGASKALTNAMREAIKKALNITSVEDEKADETTEFEDAGGRPEIEAAQEQARANLEQWAETFKAAVDSCDDPKALQRLQAKNAEQLSRLPPVTKTFFIERIERRKAVLKEQTNG